MLKFAPVIAALGIVAATHAHGAGVSKRYSYFSVGGTDLVELERELEKRGPKVNSTGRRHPGATQMEFTTKVTYEGSDRSCRVKKATVHVKAKIILPRWRSRGRADREDRIVWDTLSSDIKRHEESHVIIAKNHARELEQALEGMPSARDCDRLAARGEKISERILRKHDEAQERFDRVEGINFEARMMRLLRYRIERIENGRLSYN